MHKWQKGLNIPNKSLLTCLMEPQSLKTTQEELKILEGQWDHQLMLDGTEIDQFPQQNIIL